MTTTLKYLTCKNNNDFVHLTTQALGHVHRPRVKNTRNKKEK